mmetsp:Transcript_13268/g.25265  ORF Transcript_13268/g.25265 Transcript_13268/m.25265 type:complete len:226 (+) Transcript_13268:896-1573(+)
MSNSYHRFFSIRCNVPTMYPSFPGAFSQVTLRLSQEEEVVVVKVPPWVQSATLRMWREAASTTLEESTIPTSNLRRESNPSEEADPAETARAELVPKLSWGRCLETVASSRTGRVRVDIPREFWGCSCSSEEEEDGSGGGGGGGGSKTVKSELVQPSSCTKKLSLFCRCDCWLDVGLGRLPYEFSKEEEEEEDEDDNDQDILEGMHHDPDMEDELEKLLQKKGSK